MWIQNKVHEENFSVILIKVIVPQPVISCGGEQRLITRNKTARLIEMDMEKLVTRSFKISQLVVDCQIITFEL